MALVWLFFLYAIQGLVFGYFGPAIEVLLIERGATYDQLALFSLKSLPFLFKFLIAPI